MTCVPVVLTFNNQPATAEQQAMWHGAQFVAQRVYQSVGVYQGVANVRLVRLAGPPARTDSIQGGGSAVYNQIRAALPTLPYGDFYSVVALGVRDGGVAADQLAVVGEDWLRGATGWVTAHEWGHIAGLGDLTTGFSDPLHAETSIMAYGSRDRFAAGGMRSYFLPSEVQTIRQRWAARVGAVPAMQLYCPFADWWPGAGNKVWGYTNPVHFMVGHSIEGDADVAWEMVVNPMLPKSWHFTITKEGYIWQHYPINAMCWHAGSTLGNFEGVGVEHEGMSWEPLTYYQLQASIRLARWLAEQGVFPLEEGTGLRDHNAVYPGTACPSNRIPWGEYGYPPAPPVPEEPDVQLTPLDFNQTLAAAQSIFDDFNDIGSDQNGQAMFAVPDTSGLVINGGPLIVPAGKKVVLTILDDWDVD